MKRRASVVRGGRSSAAALAQRFPVLAGYAAEGVCTLRGLASRGIGLGGFASTLTPSRPITLAEFAASAALCRSGWSLAGSASARRGKPQRDDPHRQRREPTQYAVSARHIRQVLLRHLVRLRELVLSRSTRGHQGGKHVRKILFERRCGPQTMEQISRTATARPCVQLVDRGAESPRVHIDQLLRRHIAPQSIGSPPFRQTNPACPVSSPVPPRAPRDERRAEKIRPYGRTTNTHHALRPTHHTPASPGRKRKGRCRLATPAFVNSWR